MPFAYTERDAMLYALTVGSNEDPLATEDLPFSYELGSEPLRVLPTFAVLFGFGAMGGIMSVRRPVAGPRCGVRGQQSGCRYGCC